MDTRSTADARTGSGSPVLSALSTALLLASLGCATPSNWKRKENNIGLGAVYGLEHFDLDEAEEDSGLGLSAHGALGGEVRVGRRVHPLVELELRAQTYDSFEIDASDGTTAAVDLRAVTLDVKLYENLTERWFPDLSERWLPYLVLGLGAMQAEVEDTGGFLRAFDDSAAVARAGLGLEAFISDALAWYVEGAVLEPSDDLDGLTVIALTAGVQWRF